MNRTAREKISVRVRRLAWTLVCIALFAGSDQPVFSQEHPWQQIAEGLELGWFKLNENSPTTDSTIIILRIAPEHWEFRLLAISQTGEENGHTAKQWCEKHGLAAATNAGMFHPDYRTHVGYLKCGEHINSSVVNYYQSAAAFDPQKPGLPPFRLFDLDEVNMDSVKDDYGSVVQNLRLIKRPGENRWRQQPKKWSEAALGQDKDGRVLLYCSPLVREG